LACFLLSSALGRGAGFLHVWAGLAEVVAGAPSFLSVSLMAEAHTSVRLPPSARSRAGLQPCGIRLRLILLWFDPQAAFPYKKHEDPRRGTVFIYEVLSTP
jgi:hypothetical protein